MSFVICLHKDKKREGIDYFSISSRFFALLLRFISKPFLLSIKHTCVCVCVLPQGLHGLL